MDDLKKSLRTKLAIFDFDSLNQRMGANSLFNATFPKFDNTETLYIGDAVGRKDDWSDKDRLVAERLGATFHVPEDMFPLVVAKPLPKAAAPSKKHEVVIMVGYPASGKSTIAKILEESGYHRVDGDSLKTAKAMVKTCCYKVNSIRFYCRYQEKTFGIREICHRT